MFGVRQHARRPPIEGIILTSISSVRHLDQSVIVDAVPSPLSLAENHWVVDYTQYTQELRLSGTAGPVDWTVGGFYFDYNAIQGGRVGLTERQRPRAACHSSFRSTSCSTIQCMTIRRRVSRMSSTTRYNP